jgi:phosphoribosyl 1,2-cyclic phosphodiesterase
MACPRCNVTHALRDRYTDHVNAEEIDLILVTHFHMDHCAGLPWLMERVSSPRHLSSPIRLLFASGFALLSMHGPAHSIIMSHINSWRG